MLIEQMDLILRHLSFQMSLLHHDIIRVVCALGQGLSNDCFHQLADEACSCHPWKWDGGVVKSTTNWQAVHLAGGRQRQIVSNRRYPPAFKFFFRWPSETFRKGKHLEQLFQLYWKHLTRFLHVNVSERTVHLPTSYPCQPFCEKQAAFRIEVH